MLACLNWTPHSWSTYDVRRPFLLPIVKALLILLSVVGDVGDAGVVELLPDRRVSKPSED